jgi:hypothetical protein
VEKRKSVRLKIDGTLFGKMVVRTQLDIIDISQTGIRFNCLRRININSTCTLTLEKSDVSVELRGIVVRSVLRRTKDVKGAKMPLYEVAVHFAELDDETKKNLDQLISLLKNG